jgi:hypothetical protein
MFKRAGFITILLEGRTFMMGIKGNELGVNECPTHLITLEMGGKTSVVSTFYLTLA